MAKDSDNQYTVTTADGQEYTFEISSDYDDNANLVYTITATTTIDGGATEVVTKTFKDNAQLTSVKEKIVDRGNGVTQTYTYEGNSTTAKSIITTKGDITVTDNNGAEGANVTIDSATGNLSISVQNADGETVIIPITSDMEINADGKIKGYKYVGNQLAQGKVGDKWYNNGVEITEDATGKTKEDYIKAIMEQFPDIDSIEAVGLFEVNGKMVWRRTAFTIGERVYTNAVWDTDDTFKSFKYTIAGQEDNVKTYTKTGPDSYTISQKANNGTMVVVYYEGGLWDNTSKVSINCIKDTEGNNYTGIVMGNYYEDGTLAKGTDKVGNTLYIDGVKDSEGEQRVVIIDGVRYLFDNGTLETGNKTVKGTDGVDRLYVDGRAASGQIGSDYYVDGVKQAASQVKPSDLMAKLKSTSGDVISQASITTWYNANKNSADLTTKAMLEFIQPLLTLDSSGNVTGVSELFKVIANNFEYGTTSSAAGNNLEISTSELIKAFTGGTTNTNISSNNNAIKELERKMGILKYLGFSAAVDITNNNSIQGIDNVVITPEGLRRNSALLANTTIYVKNKNGGFTGYVFDASGNKTVKEYNDRKEAKPASTNSNGDENIQYKLVNVNGEMLWRAASWDNSAGNHFTNTTYDAQGRRTSHVWTDKNNASNTHTFEYLYQSASESASNYTKYSMTYTVDGKTLTFTHTGKYPKEGEPSRFDNGSLVSVKDSEGKDYTGVVGNYYFEAGKFATGLKAVETTLYENGAKCTADNKVHNKVLYKKGVKSTAAQEVYDNTLFISGTQATGTVLHNNTLYVNGTKATGTVLHDNTLYVNGTKATGTFLHDNTLYVNGTKATGNDTYDGYLYNNGVKVTDFGLTVRELINAIEYGDDGTAANDTELDETGKKITDDEVLNYLKQSYADARIKFILEVLGIIDIAANGTITINTTVWKEIANGANGSLTEAELSKALYGVDNKITTQIEDGTGLTVDLC